MLPRHVCLSLFLLFFIGAFFDLKRDHTFSLNDQNHYGKVGTIGENFFMHQGGKNTGGMLSSEEGVMLPGAQGV